MPGAGKSKVGALLARRLGLLFHDSDEEVARFAGRSVEQLFQAEGQAAFRGRERRAIARLVEAGPAIIATGGGAMAEPATRALLMARTTTVWLRASVETLSRRLAQAPPRPLLVGADVLTRLERLQAERQQLYAEAHIHLDTDALDIDSTVDAVIQAIGRHR